MNLKAEMRLKQENERLKVTNSELLAALEAMLQAYAPDAESWAQKEGEEVLHSDVQKARAAIRKAREVVS